MKEGDSLVFREISVDGMEPFARGGTGECYYLDEETILKLYYEGYPREYVIAEKEGARAALVAGVPTAISFGMVRAGNRYGLVYEKLDAKTLSKSVTENPGRIGELAEKYAELAADLHHAAIGDRNFKPATEQCREGLAKVDYADGSVKAAMSAFMDELDRYGSYVHGDFQPNNVMVSGDEIFLIDMGDFAIGCPLFDLATTYFCFFCSPEVLEGGVSSFTGMTLEQHREFWEVFIRAYYGNDGMPDDDKALFPDVILLKEMRFERIFGHYYPDEYCADVRARVLRRWGKR